jgi:hypothetical protein
VRERRDNIRAREPSDQEILEELFAIADDISSLHRRSGELAIRLDQLLGVAAERWANEALDRIDQQERAELAACGR